MRSLPSRARVVPASSVITPVDVEVIVDEDSVAFDDGVITRLTASKLISAVELILTSL
jgi:hypothetical protein